MYENINIAIDKYRKLILDTERYIWENPETGFKEIKTSAYLAKEFEKLGYKLNMAGNIPGFCAEFDTGRPGPTVLVFGEMDSLICPDHPQCDKETHTAHVCGHNTQCAALLGVAAALKEKDVSERLCGKVRLCAVPAEELIELGYRTTLVEKGIIKHYSGKGEFLFRGLFDGVSMAMMFHTRVGEEFSMTKGGVGCLVKNVTYKGKSAHAGACPEDGINALYAATLGINAANAMRETFRDDDMIRFHPIITKGGVASNAIPDTVEIETYVRGKTIDAIIDANKKVNRALTGAAISMGAHIQINDKAFYAPYVPDQNFADVAVEAMGEVSDKVLNNGEISAGSTDMGILTSLMPAVQPYAGGAIGTDHGADYYIENPEIAAVSNARAQVIILDKLLSNDAAGANDIIAKHKPLFKSKEEYFAKVDAMLASGERVNYGDGDITAKD